MTTTRDRDRDRDRDRHRDPDRRRRRDSHERDRHGGRTDRNRHSDRHGGRRNGYTRDRDRDRRGKDSRDTGDRRGGGRRRGDGRRDRRQDRRSHSRSRRRDRRRGQGGDRRQADTSEYSTSEEVEDSRSSCDNGESSKKKAKKSGDDKGEIVHFEWQKGEVLSQRYEIVKLLGDGTFGRVVLAMDRHETGRQVAIKVIRDVKRYIENGKIEADILKDIRREDPSGERSRSAIMSDTFSHERHFCMVFQALGSSLYDFLKANEFRGFWMQDIQSFAKQSLEALAFLHGQLKMTHTDLKPENILLESADRPRPGEFPRESSWLGNTRSSKKQCTSPYLRPASNRIKLIDFGNATYEDEHHSSIINTRQYRGPEVVLSLGWNELSDIWSLGCIFMELYTGELLFGTHENAEHLALMERSLEPLPPKMLADAPKSVRAKYLTFLHYANEWRLNWPALSSGPSSERHVRSQRKLSELTTKEHIMFAEFTGYLLTVDPSRRPSAAEAVRHPFFQQEYND
eukprot:TRINITY_DN21121_c0_g1_i2.p1 TRINITY_DN21121_c0_g1~~TRINITY_DN21121_c0_g1_i2.p1  ORF type:complete len:550 (+),score=79.17 TRINITY_DN21121_c0_g1_i2:114-1652(+)